MKWIQNEYDELTKEFEKTGNGFGKMQNEQAELRLCWSDEK
jgi:hypothetical protein